MVKKLCDVIHGRHLCSKCNFEWKGSKYVFWAASTFEHFPDIDWENVDIALSLNKCHYRTYHATDLQSIQVVWRLPTYDVIKRSKCIFEFYSTNDEILTITDHIFIERNVPLFIFPFSWYLIISWIKIVN